MEKNNHFKIVPRFDSIRITVDKKPKNKLMFCIFIFIYEFPQYYRINVHVKELENAFCSCVFSDSNTFRFST